MKLLGIFSEPVNLQDYPDYAGIPRSSNIPGYILLEQYAVSGVRVSVGLGLLGSTAYFYLFHRPRLPFADRPLARLHHYFYPSAGYSTPIGIVGGTGYHMYQYHQSYSLPKLMEQERREKAAAKRSYDLRERRRSAVVRRVQEQQSWMSKLRVWMGWEPEPSRVALTRLGLEREIPWVEMLTPYSLSWVASRSVVHDPAWYKLRHSQSSSAASASASADSRPETKRGENIRVAGPRATAAPLAVRSPSRLSSGEYDKLQIDNIVSRAIFYRKDETNERWTRSAGRCGTCGTFACLLLWNSGTMLFRMSMGLGLGVFAGGMISAARLDEAFVHLT